VTGLFSTDKICIIATGQIGIRRLEGRRPS
jgi:hypothetical protein